MPLWPSSITTLDGSDVPAAAKSAAVNVKKIVHPDAHDEPIVSVMSETPPRKLIGWPLSNVGLSTAAGLASAVPSSGTINPKVTVGEIEESSETTLTVLTTGTPALPAASVDVICTVWVPLGKPVCDTKFSLQSAGGLLSNWHVDVTALPAPSAENSISIESESVKPPSATSLSLPSKATPMVVVGLSVSTVQVKDCVDPTLPAASVELICTVCSPSPKSKYDTGLVQDADGLLSNVHVDVTALPVPSAVNSILIESEFVEPPGATSLLLPSVATPMVVVGLSVSTVTVMEFVAVPKRLSITIAIIL